MVLTGKAAACQDYRFTSRQEEISVQYNDYINATKEYLQRYDEFAQFVKSTKQEIKYCKDLLAQDAAPASPVLSSAGGGGGEKQSVEDRALAAHEKLRSRIAGYEQELADIEPIIQKVKSSMEALNSFNSLQHHILDDRYRKRRSWDAVAMACNVSYSTCRAQAQDGLVSLTRMVFGPKAVPFQTSIVFFHQD